MKVRDLLEDGPRNLDEVIVNGTSVLDNGKKRDIWKGDLKVSSFGLTTLEGCPRVVGGDFWCSNNKLTSLDGCPEIVGGDFKCVSNPMKSISGIHLLVKEIRGEFWGGSSITHVLGLCLIKRLKKVELGSNKKVENILNRHLDQGRAGMVDAFDELMEAGLDAYAQL